MFLALFAPRAFAVDLYWGGGAGALTDDNWFSDAALTTPATRANGDVINLASGTVFIAGTGTVYDTNIGLAAGNNAAVIVSGTWNNTNGELSIGNAADSSGALTIQTGGTVRANTFYVGNYGSGYLQIDEAGALYNNANAMFGRNTGGSGTAVINGSWTANTYIQLGYIANSQGNALTIGQTGTVKTTSYIRIGGATNSNGSVTVDGLLDAGTYVSVGYAKDSRDNVVTIGQTGTIKATYMRIGGDINTSGTVTVDGVLEVPSGISIGYAAGTALTDPVTRGTLRIGTTGTILAASESALGYFGMAASSITSTEVVSPYGDATIDGVLKVAAVFSVGRSGDGFLTINSTGTLIDTTGYVGRYYNDMPGHGHATGTAVVNGSWVNEADFYVADGGRGVLFVNEGGVVVAANSGFIGNGTASSGTAVIAGRLDLGDNLTVGQLGDGHLHVVPGGVVIAGGYYAQNAQSELAVTLDAARATPFVSITGKATLSGTLRVEALDSIPGYATAASAAKAGDLASAVILRADSGFTDDFASIVTTPALTGTAGLPDYIFNGKSIGGGVEYRIGHILAWNAPAASAHGSFTVASGATFTVDTPLASRADASFITTGWDGKSLAKRGPGTLVLAAAGTRAGDTIIESGTLRIATPEVSLGNLINNATLDLGGSSAGYHTATADSLVGAGVIILAANADATAGDRLVITGNASGAHTVLVSIDGAAPAAASPAQVAALITVNGTNTATFDGTGATGLTVTFAPQGGTVSPASKTITQNTPYGELPAPVRANAVFEGWFTAPEGGAPVTAGTIVAADAASHILYARWTTGHASIAITPDAGNDLYGSIIDETGAPVAGVVVSDGFQCVVTDAQGVYQMKRHARARTVYYSTPENFAINTRGIPGRPGSALFYTKLTAGQRYNFDLVKLPAVEKDFILLGVGDPQVNDNPANLKRYRDETIPDLAQFRESASLPVYAVLLGDICFDTLPMLTPIRDTTDLAGIPYFAVIGNHDHDTAISDDFDSGARFEEVYGPVNFSFNRGDVHIIGLDNVLYSGNKNYVYGFTDEIVEWLRQDLSHVPKSKFLVVTYHMPIRNDTTLKNYNAVMDLAQGLRGRAFHGRPHPLS